MKGVQIAEHVLKAHFLGNKFINELPYIEALRKHHNIKELTVGKGLIATLFKRNGKVIILEVQIARLERLFLTINLS